MVLWSSLIIIIALGEYPKSVLVGWFSWRVPESHRHRMPLEMPPKTKKLGATSQSAAHKLPTKVMWVVMVNWLLIACWWWWFSLVISRRFSCRDARTRTIIITLSLQRKIHNCDPYQNAQTKNFSASLNVPSLSLCGVHQENYIIILLVYVSVGFHNANWQRFLDITTNITVTYVLTSQSNNMPIFNA